MLIGVHRGSHMRESLGVWTVCCYCMEMPKCKSDWYVCRQGEESVQV